MDLLGGPSLEFLILVEPIVFLKDLVPKSHMDIVPSSPALYTSRLLEDFWIEKLPRENIV